MRIRLASELFRWIVQPKRKCEQSAGLRVNFLWISIIFNVWRRITIIIPYTMMNGPFTARVLEYVCSSRCCILLLADDRIIISLLQTERFRRKRNYTRTAATGPHLLSTGDIRRKNLLIQRTRVIPNSRYYYNTFIKTICIHEFIIIPRFYIVNNIVFTFKWRIK